MTLGKPAKGLGKVTTAKGEATMPPKVNDTKG